MRQITVASPLSDLDGDMSQKELDLFEFASRLMAGTRTCSAQVVGAYPEMSQLAASSLTIDKITLGVNSRSSRFRSELDPGERPTHLVNEISRRFLSRPDQNGL